MKQLWLKYAAKIDAMSPRERMLVFFAGLLVTVAILFFAAIDPAQRRHKALLAQMETQKAEIAALQKDGSADKEAHPDAQNRARAEALRQQIGALDERLKALHQDLVPAGRVNALLQEILARDARLTLVSLRTLAAEPLVGGPEKPAAAGATAPGRREVSQGHVYKHGVEITLQGSYAHLHDYLMRLEQAPWRMFWWRARLNADEQARLTLTVTVYTLSLDKAWLQV